DGDEGDRAAADEPPCHRRRREPQREQRALDGAAHLPVAGVASAGYTFTSTRRFFAWFSGSEGSAGRSQPMPAVENWFGCSVGNLRMTASFTELARLSDSSCTTLLGTDAFIEPSLSPSMTTPPPPHSPPTCPY